MGDENKHQNAEGEAPVGLTAEDVTKIVQAQLKAPMAEIQKTFLAALDERFAKAEDRAGGAGEAASGGAGGASGSNSNSNSGADDTRSSGKDDKSFELRQLQTKLEKLEESNRKLAEERQAIEAENRRQAGLQKVSALLQAKDITGDRLTNALARLAWDKTLDLDAEGGPTMKVTDPRTGIEEVISADKGIEAWVESTGAAFRPAQQTGGTGGVSSDRRGPGNPSPKTTEDLRASLAAKLII